MKVLSDLLGIWPAHAELARDIEIEPRHVGVMVQRQKIPVEYWTPIIEAAKVRAKEARKAGDTKLAEQFEAVTPDALLKLHDSLAKARAA